MIESENYSQSAVRDLEWATWVASGGGESGREKYNASENPDPK